MSSGSYSSQVSKNEQNTYTTTNTSYDLAGAQVGLTGNNFVQVAQDFAAGLQASNTENAALAQIASGATGRQAGNTQFLVVAAIALVAIVFMLQLGKGAG